MRYKVRAASLAAVTMSLIAGTAAAQVPTKIAYVNPQAIFQAAPGRAEAEATFRRETEAYRTELTKMGEALNTLVSDYQANETKLSAADKERRQRAIGAKEDSLRTRQQQLESQAGERQSQLMAPIMESVRKVLEDIRVEDGYAMILSSEPGASPILVADKNLDITERVVARLRTMSANKPAATQQQRPAGAPASTPSAVTRPKPPTS